MTKNYTFEINLDLDKLMSRYSGKNVVPDFGGALERGLSEGLDDFSKQLLNKLVSIMKDYGLGDSRTIGAINVVKLSDGISIRVENEYFMFIEYGTGVVGERNPHPIPSRDGWTYDTNKHGETGWWYPSRSDDPNTTKYQDKDGNYWAWTKGQASRPFMYKTWLWGSQSVTNIVNKHVNREFKELERKFR